jgi:hypothetical protein
MIKELEPAFSTAKLPLGFGFAELKSSRRLLRAN